MNVKILAIFINLLQIAGCGSRAILFLTTTIAYTNAWAAKGDAMSQPTSAHQPVLFLACAAALMALTVSYSVDAEPLGTTSADTSPSTQVAMVPTFEMPTFAPSAIVLTRSSVYRVEQGMVKFFFAPSKTELPISAESALQDIVAAISDGHRVEISGFHDETGNAQQNIMLSQRRAVTIQKRLIALGAPAHAIALKKPAVAIGSPDHAEARRVEVALLR